MDIERPTSNIEHRTARSWVRAFGSTFDVRRSMFDVQKGKVAGQ